MEKVKKMVLNIFMAVNFQLICFVLVLKEYWSVSISFLQVCFFFFFLNHSRDCFSQSGDFLLGVSCWANNFLWVTLKIKLQVTFQSRNSQLRIWIRVDSLSGIAYLKIFVELDVVEFAQAACALRFGNNISHYCSLNTCYVL